MKAKIKCELNGRAYAPGDDIDPRDADAAKARGWAVDDKPKAFKAEK